MTDVLVKEEIVLDISHIRKGKINIKMKLCADVTYPSNFAVALCFFFFFIERKSFVE